MTRVPSFIIIVVALTIALAGCGKKSPTSPDGSGGNNSGSGGSGGSGSANCGGVTVGIFGCPKGLISATIGGQTFNGGVANGGSSYNPIPPVPSLGIPALDFILLSGLAADGTQLTITVRAKIGAQSIGQGVLDPDVNNVSSNSASLSTVKNGALDGSWFINVAGGSGTIIVSTVSTTAASGSFNMTLVPGNSVATALGPRTVVGTFNVTF